jgi:hypothetical protein
MASFILMCAFICAWLFRKMKIVLQIKEFASHEPNVIFAGIGAHVGVFLQPFDNSKAEIIIGKAGDSGEKIGSQVASIIK